MQRKRWLCERNSNEATDIEEAQGVVQRDSSGRWGRPHAVIMCIALVMVVRGLLTFVMMMRGRVLVIVVGMRRARMGKESKGGLSTSPMVNNHMRDGQQKGQHDPPAYAMPHGRDCRYTGRHAPSIHADQPWPCWSMSVTAPLAP
jgi:hypothetical protein